ncbi:hypothetical protein CLOM_g2462 [Closterium sp. NIES-68]|nr:hypothetical protein CLOM_g2462 [Closterium sp. NIES-68]GJP74350.1 hypothetical protein CLOP_g4944 [Closterium sp. NIES-67]
MAASGFTPWWMGKAGEGEEQSCPTMNRLFDLSQGRESPLPRWTKADIEAFAKEDPVHGNQVLLSRQASLIATGGAAVGGLALAAYNYRYSRSIGGAFLTLVVGAVTSWAVSEEAANIGLGLYKFSPMDANFKFIDWWAAKHPEVPAAEVTSA